jgi:hypothetical protein
MLPEKLVPETRVVPVSPDEALIRGTHDAVTLGPDRVPPTVLRQPKRDISRRRDTYVGRRP